MAIADGNRVIGGGGSDVQLDGQATYFQTVHKLVTLPIRSEIPMQMCRIFYFLGIQRDHVHTQDDRGRGLSRGRR